MDHHGQLWQHSPNRLVEVVCAQAAHASAQLERVQGRFWWARGYDGYDMCVVCPPEGGFRITLALAGGILGLEGGWDRGNLC